MFINLIQNSTLLISLTVLYGLIKWSRLKNKTFDQLLQGIWFGSVAVVAMMMPYEYTPGILYDGRSVILTLAGLWGGGYTAVVSIFMAGAYRIFAGGTGIWAGLATILFTGLTGLFFRQLFKNKLHKLKILHFLGIGIVSHLLTLAAQFFLPENERLLAIYSIWVPILSILPITFAVIAKLFQLIDRYIQSEQKIREAESLYRTTLLSIGDAVICTDKNGTITQMNTIAEQLTGWKLSGAKEQKLEEVFRIINENNREKVESPFEKVLNSGSIVGLANHTLLISKEGKEIPISDSGAPIKNDRGEITGVVLVFRDQTEERAYQRRITQSETQYRELVESTDSIAWEYDILIDKWVYVAPQVTEKLGWLPEEWTNLEFWKNNLHPDERESATNYCLDCAARGESHSLEYRFKRKNGGYIWIRDVVSVELQDNKPVKIRGVMFDITERKNTEIDLKEKNTFIQTVLDNLPIGVALNKINEGTAFYMNRRFEEIYGWKASELKNIPEFFQKVYPDENYRKKVIKMIMEGVESGDAQNMHWENIQIARHDGTTGFINAVNIPLPEQNTMVSTVMDITTRIMAEKELQQSEERFRKAVLLAPIPIMVHDEDGNVINLSEGWTHFSGYTIEEIPTIKEWTKKVYDREAKKVENYVARLFNEDETVISDEFRIISKSGEKRIWNFYTTPLGKLGSGKKIMLSIAPDITQRKKVQNELITAKEKAEESERLKTAFLANMSHEIRTPLNGILGFTNLLTGDDHFSEKKKKEFGSIIQKSAEGLLKIINDILDISRLETDKTTIDKKPFEAERMLTTLYSLFQKRLTDSGKTGVVLKLEKPDRPAILITDENRLTQVFSNLLDNALRFTSEGSVTFGVSEVNGNKLTFFVTDTGIGIPKEKHTMIFDRFSQSNNSAVRSYGGTGLGLSIVKKLLELMGSEISLESEPGKGTTFRFELPFHLKRENGKTKEKT